MAVLLGDAQERRGLRCRSTREDKGKNGNECDEQAL